MDKIKYHLLQALIAFDRVINTVIGGDASETLSSVAYRKWRDKKPFGFMKSVIDTLFYDGHCAQAFADDRAPKLQA